MNKVCKMVLVIFLIFNVYSIVFANQVVYAARNITDTSIWTLGNNFLDVGASQGGETINEDTEKYFGSIVGVLWGIGLLVIVVSTVVLGIKYMTVSPNEKSRIKQATTPYIIGVVVIFGAITIWRLMIDILEGSMLG